MTNMRLAFVIGLICSGFALTRGEQEAPVDEILDERVSEILAQYDDVNVESQTLNEFVLSVPSDPMLRKELGANEHFMAIVRRHFKVAKPDLVTPAKDGMPHERNSTDLPKARYVFLLGDLGAQDQLREVVSAMPGIPYDKSLRNTWGLASFGGLGVDFAQSAFINGDTKTIEKLCAVFQSLPTDYQAAIVDSISTRPEEIVVHQLKFLEILEAAMMSGNGVERKNFVVSVERYFARLKSRSMVASEPVQAMIKSDYPALKSLLE